MVLCFTIFTAKVYIKKTQGSINQNDLNKIIKKLGKKNILNADEFLNRHLENKLKKK